MPDTRRGHNDLIAELREQFAGMLIATHYAKTKAVLDAIRAVPRHLFVDQYYTFGKPRRLIRVDPASPTPAQLKTIYSYTRWQPIFDLVWAPVPPPSRAS